MKQKCYKRNPIQMFGHNSVLSLDSFPAFLNDPRNQNKMFYVLPKQIFDITYSKIYLDKQAGYNRIFYGQSRKNTFMYLHK